MAETIGFFNLESTKDKKGVIGAILVTDDLGMPQEFRVSYPVKPTPIQTRLYGESLLTHIGVTLTGEPLYKSLKQKPELLIVGSDRFLPLSNEVGKTKVIHVKRTGETIVVGATEENLTKTILHSTSDRFQPINVYFADSDDNEETKEIIGKYFQSIDLLEPFERIKGAVEALAGQDEKFR